MRDVDVEQALTCAAKNVRCVMAIWCPPRGWCPCEYVSHDADNGIESIHVHDIMYLSHVSRLCCTGTGSR